MRIPQPPKTPYEKMIWKALYLKLKANERKKKPSKRDEIREFNRTHVVQLKLRPSLGLSSLARSIESDVEGEASLS